MKKIMIAVVIGLLLVAALATTALADNGPHGGFTSSTDACAGCHRAHTAQGVDSLLKAADEETLCFSCHDGTGAYTDAKNGIFGFTYNGVTTTASPAAANNYNTSTNGDAGAPLFAGGFAYTEMNHAWNGKGFYNDTTPRTMSAVTSAHAVGDSNLTVWGAGNYAAAGVQPNVTYSLECTSCHTPHGMGGKDSSGNAVPTYRILRYQATGSNGYEVTTGTLFSVNAASLSTGAMGITVAPATGAAGGATIVDTTSYQGGPNHWYSLNDDATIDQGLAALTKPHVGATDILTTPLWQPISQSKGDYSPAARGDQYRRPALTASSTSLSCSWTAASGITYMPSANPPVTTNNCAAYANGGGSLPAITERFNNVPQRLGVAYFCSECHDRYLADSASRTLAGKSTDGTYMYRHASGSGDASSPSVTCVDCHVAHGTSATETTLSASATLAQQPIALNSSALLKLDNREMCARCHFGTIGVQLSLTNP
jgi:predicted CXXCH cytochrome family protein